MIEVTYYIKDKDGKWTEAVNTFAYAKKASDFIFLMKSKGGCYFGWLCTDPEDNEYLNRIHG